MSTAIAVYSKHHGNTRKLVDAIKNANPEIKVIDVTENKVAELSAYDAIGVASGIYASKFNSELMEYLREKLPSDKKVFAIYTYAMKMGHYAKDIKALVEERHCKFVGEYCCQGYNTFGPFKLVGGTAKGHPTDEEIQGAVDFYSHLML